MTGKIITREEVEKRSLILPEVLANIPERCECGGEVGFSSDLWEAICLNPKCFHKTAKRSYGHDRGYVGESTVSSDTEEA